MMRRVGYSSVIQRVGGLLTGGTVLLCASAVLAQNAPQPPAAPGQTFVRQAPARGETVTDHTLKELEQGYPERLLRIHRHTLVGLRYLQGLVRDGRGHWFARLTDDTRLPVSRRHASAVRERLQDGDGAGL